MPHVASATQQHRLVEDQIHRGARSRPMVVGDRLSLQHVECGSIEIKQIPFAASIAAPTAAAAQMDQFPHSGDAISAATSSGLRAEKRCCRLGRQAHHASCHPRPRGCTSSPRIAPSCQNAGMTGTRAWGNSAKEISTTPSPPVAKRPMALSSANRSSIFCRAGAPGPIPRPAAVTRSHTRSTAGGSARARAMETARQNGD